MSNKFAAECVDRSLQDLCSRDLPFGGKGMMVWFLQEESDGGHSRQIPPVVEHGSQVDAVSACLNRSLI